MRNDRSSTQPARPGALRLLGVLQAVLWAAQPLVFAASSPPEAPPSAEGAAPAARPEPARGVLEERLAQEKARLARLQAELQRLERGGSPEEPAQDAKPGEAKAATPAPEPKSEGEQEPRTPLVRQPRLAAADVLYRLGRYAEARAVYEAFARQPKPPAADRFWALLQAGNCCRRLHNFDAAIACFQTALADHPTHPWATSHVPWALRTAQWEKRWHTVETRNSERGAGAAEDPGPVPSSDRSTGE